MVFTESHDSGVCRHRRDRHVARHTGDQTGVASGHTHTGADERQRLHPHLSERQEGLGVFDLDFAWPAANGHIQHRPAQQTIDGAAPPGAVIYRHPTPVTVAHNAHPPALMVEHNVLDNPPLKPQNLRRDDCPHMLYLRVSSKSRVNTALQGCQSSHFSVGFTGRAR
jgi:hypothetical protein